MIVKSSNHTEFFTQMNNLVWYRRDLRISDNRSLYAACNGCGEVLLFGYAVAMAAARRIDRQTSFLARLPAETEADLLKDFIQAAIAISKLPVRQFHASMPAYFSWVIYSTPPPFCRIRQYSR